MRILIDTGHPAHVHLFRPFAKQMLQQGHQLLFTARDKECTLELLESSGFEFVVLGKNRKTALGKIAGLFIFDVGLFKVVKKFKPQITLSHSSFYLSQVSALFSNITNITFEDTFNREQVLLYKPFTNYILTGNYPHPSLGKKERHYAGYHELAYLHPNHFQPDKSIFKRLNLNQDEPYTLLRFVNWSASHDVGHKGVSLENIRLAIRRFQKYGQVFISAEGLLPQDLEPYRLKCPAAELHHIIASAHLLYGESATMATEAAVLGVPAIYIDNSGRYYTKELQDRYGLVYNFSELERDQTASIRKGKKILANYNPEVWQDKRQQLLADKIDTTQFLVEFVESLYPQSHPQSHPQP